MKQFFLFSCFALFAITLSAQTLYVTPNENEKDGSPVVAIESYSSPAPYKQYVMRKVEDTLDMYHVRSTGFTIYTYGGTSSFPVFGTNNRYIFVGSTYDNTGFTNIKGALIAYAAKVIRGAADNIGVSVYHTSNGFPTGSPIETASISVNAIDTASSVDSGLVFTWVPFTNIPMANTNFAVMVQTQYTAAQGDTVDLTLIWSNKHGDGNGEQRAVAIRPTSAGGFQSVKVGSMTEIVLPNGQPLNADVMIIPVIERVPTGINEPLKLNGIALHSVFPNPVTSESTIKIEIEKADEVSVTLLDMNGRLVRNLYKSKLTPGIHEIKADMNGIAPGNYILTLMAGTSRMATTLIKQ